MERWAKPTRTTLRLWNNENESYDHWRRHDPAFNKLKLVQAATVRFNAWWCLDVLWVPGHCGLIDNELADQEAKLDFAEH